MYLSRSRATDQDGGKKSNRRRNKKEKNSRVKGEQRISVSSQEKSERSSCFVNILCRIYSVLFRFEYGERFRRQDGGSVGE